VQAVSKPGRDVASSPAAPPCGGIDAAALAARLVPCGAPLPRAALDAALLAPLQRFLARPGKRVRARLVAIGWRLGGADGEPPPNLPLAVELLHAGSLIVDDVEDGSTHRRGGRALHREIGAALAINAGTFLYFWPFELVRQLALPPARELACTRRLSDTFLRCHAGQALDLGVAVDSLPRSEIAPLVRAASELKTGGLMALALSLGAAAAGAPAGPLAALEACGRSLGVAFQMLDDLENLRGVRAPEKRGEDLRHGRVAWPWAWAAAAGPAEHWEALRAASLRVRGGLEPPDGLAAWLAELVGERGRADARATAEQALAELEEELGPAVPASGLDRLVRSLASGHA
jgi:geranylgeranyl pyrophosphate synthase